MTVVGVVTSARSDATLYGPLFRAIDAHPALALRILATGMHLHPDFGFTVTELEAAGFAVHERVPSLESSDDPAAIAVSMGAGVAGFARLFSRWRPDVLVVLGDRFDMFPAALAALPFRIPVAHIAGGEITEGAIDDALRHSLTKLSHLHFVALEEYRDRVLQMGEESWRVTVSGALAIDAMRETTLWGREETAERFGFRLDQPVALITYHPVTLEYDATAGQIANVLAALERADIQCLFTYPNADTASRQIIAAIEHFCMGRTDRRVIINAGRVGYLSLMNAVSIMVGNSSSGLIEAPSFELPVVNIGTRQTGRVRTSNVVQVGYDADDILAGIRRALDPRFRADLRGLHNPYGDGHAAERIVQRLATLPAPATLLRKRFVTQAVEEEASTVA